MKMTDGKACKVTPACIELKQPKKIESVFCVISGADPEFLESGVTYI